MKDTPELGRWGNEMLAAFPPAIRTHLDPYLSQTMLAQGALCFGAGDVVGRVYFPTSGLISLLVSTGGDAFVEAGVVGSEGVAGLQSAVWSRPSFTRAIVQVPGSFWSVSAEPLRRAVQGSDEARALVSGYTELLWAEAQQLAACNVIHPALQRLARWLLQAADRSRSNQMPVKQEVLAEMIGVRRTSVTLLARDLQDRGAIKYGRANIMILDRAALEAVACQCYHVIQRLYRGHSETLGARRAK